MSLSKRPCKKKDFGGEIKGGDRHLLGVISDELISLRGNVEGMKTFRELLFLYLFSFRLILTSLNSRIACRADRKRKLKVNMPFRRYFLIAKLTFGESLLQLRQRVDLESRAPLTCWIIPTSCFSVEAGSTSFFKCW